MGYTNKQKYFIDLLLSGKNIFLTGKAGTGKSFIVKEAIEILKANRKKVAAVAPTGISANNIEGQTIHSLFQINPYGICSFTTCNFLKSAKREVLSKIDTLFIDEVSMLRPDILDGMHWTLKKNGLDGLEKRQIIFIGDLHQLPPILKDNERSVLYQTYDGDTFDFAKIYKKLDVEVIELDEVLRQTNEDFIHALNIIRGGGKSEYFRQFVTNSPAGIILAPHNSTVEEYNQDGLNNQAGEELTFDAIIDGEAKPEDFHLERRIRVKNGCKIMYLVNSQNNPLRNGTLGTFVSHNGCHYIRVNDTDFALDMVTLSKKTYVYNSEMDCLELVDLGSITQYPFKLAYALSIHKAQGLTFDEVTIDLRRPCFQKGQMYVALSRVRTPEGLKIII
jgi:ATP-dependent DNA helicase PIF1